jgi:hypothetical protein
MPPIREIYPILHCSTLAAILPVMIKCMPIPRVLALLEPRKGYSNPSVNACQLARIAGSVVGRWPRFGIGECLLRSLVLYSLLLKFAYRPVLMLGGKLSDGALDCHCWIEVDGKPLNESNDPGKQFKVLYAHKHTK